MWAKDDPTEFVGQHGRYVLGPQLSAGEGCAVYRAHVLDGSDPHPLAIKMALDSRGADSIERERLLISSLGAPGHASVARLIDAGRTGSQAWIALAWAGSSTLRAWMSSRSGNLAVPEALDVVRQLASALAHVHACGWVHADVAPANVMYDGCQLTLVDFGSARRASTFDAHSGPPRGTGTPGYVAPERLRGRSWDHRADAYSLGCIWFELMVGRPLFVAGDVDGMTRQHLTSALPSIGQLAPALTRPLAQLLSELLAKDPHERPLDLRDVVVAIDQANGNEREAPSPFPAQCLESRLFGRARVWSALRRHVAQVAEQRGRSVILVGESGLGRTRLLQELQWEAENCSVDTCVVSGLDPRAALNALHGAAEQAAGRLGLAVLLDDADRAACTWSVLREAIPRVPSPAILLVGTARPSHALPCDDATEYRLEPLSREALRRIVTDALGRPVNAELDQLLIRYAQGNPKRLRDVLQELVRSRALVMSSSGWAVSGQHASGPSAAATTGASGTMASLAVGAFRRSSISELADLGEQLALRGEWRLSARAFREAAARCKGRDSDDPAQEVRHLEAAWQVLRPRAMLDPRARHATARVGFRLLRLLSREADHVSVHATSQELIGLSVLPPLTEAKVRRIHALSYRIMGEHADALQQLREAKTSLQRASVTPRRVVERERIELLLALSWAYYSAHDARASLRCANAAAAPVRHVGTSVQRAEVLLHRAKAVALVRQYDVSDRVISLQRRALAVYEGENAPLSARVSAQGNLAFMLLWGSPEQIRESLSLSEAILPHARRSGDVTALARVVAYLAVGYRRAGNVEQCEAYARMTAELSLDCGNTGYLGLAKACLGWVAIRRGRTEEGWEECERAMALWQRRRCVDPSRRTEYPFQWLGVTPLVSVAAAEDRSHACRSWIEDLRHPTQARLAAPVQALLEGAPSCDVQPDFDAWLRWSEDFVRAASAHRYL